MVFFGALLHIIGPQHDWCDLCSCMIDRDLEDFKKNQQEQYELMTSKPEPLNFFDMQREGYVDPSNDHEDASHFMSQNNSQMPLNGAANGQVSKKEYLTAQNMGSNGAGIDALDFAESKPSPSGKNRKQHVKGEINGMRWSQIDK